MAEQILFNNIADVLTKLGSSAVQRTGSAFGVGKELRKLEKKLATIKGVLVDAEKRQQESDAVKSWVRRLKDVVYDADDLLDDFETLQLQKHGGVLRQRSKMGSMIILGIQGKIPTNSRKDIPYGGGEWNFNYKRELQNVFIKKIYR